MRGDAFLGRLHRRAAFDKRVGEYDVLDPVVYSATCCELRRVGIARQVVKRCLQLPESLPNTSNLSKANMFPRSITYQHGEMYAFLALVDHKPFERTALAWEGN